MRCDSKDAGNFSDANDIKNMVLTIQSSIVTSRKRKLRELFAVATHAESLPQDAFANPDAPTTTQAEWQFLQANDILQYVYLILFPFHGTFLLFLKLASRASSYWTAVS